MSLKGLCACRGALSLEHELEARLGNDLPPGCFLKALRLRLTAFLFPLLCNLNFLGNMPCFVFIRGHARCSLVQRVMAAHYPLHVLIRDLRAGSKEEECKMGPFS